jgi:hypothetical protein
MLATLLVGVSAGACSSPSRYQRGEALVSAACKAFDDQTGVGTPSRGSTAEALKRAAIATKPAVTLDKRWHDAVVDFNEMEDPSTKVDRATEVTQGINATAGVMSICASLRDSR